MSKSLVETDEFIINKIYLIRGQKVMLDRDLAELYGVETRVLNQAVKRNLKGFPEDFMFQLKDEEYNSLRSQIVMLKKSRGAHSKYLPYVFTENGVAMLSSVLNSDIAIDINIHIIRVFTRMIEMLFTHKDILLKLEQLEKQVSKNNTDIQHIFMALKQLLNKPALPKKRIGFSPDDLR